MRRNAPHIDVAGLPVVDLSREGVREALVMSYLSNAKTATIGFAVHVSALEYRRDTDFIGALHAADVVYADGWSIQLLARVQGALRIEAAPTTELGHAVLESLATVLGRAPRVALVGGPAGLAERASAALRLRHRVDIVFVEHGYHRDWTHPLELLKQARPDIAFIGMGAPREHLWVFRHQNHLPPLLAMTCGGWFGFLAGEERRAPQWMRQARLEWLFRALQSPRLIPRYGRGVVTIARLLVQQRRRGAGPS